MAKALPILGSILAPTMASAMGLGISPLLMSAIGGGLGSWAATGKPLAGLEGAGLGLLTGGLMGGAGGLGSLFGSGGGAGASTAAQAAALSGLGGMGAQSTPALASALAPSFDPSTTLAANYGALPDLSGMGAASTPALANAVAANYSPDAALMSGMTGLGSMALPSSALSNLSFPGVNPGAVGSGGPGLGGTRGGGFMGGIGGLMKNPMMMMAMLGGLGSLTGGGNPTPTPATAFKSPGLTQYQPQHWVAPPAGYVPGVSPEPYMLSNPGGFAAGGAIHPLAMIKPPAMIHAPMLSPTRIAPPASNYAAHSIAHMAMMPHVMPPSGVHFPMKFDAGGDIGGMDPNQGGIAGLAVPPGVGDGQSDSVPATIDGQAPALLSSGEHVIPSDVVSHLGNGDTAAGHRALHAMTSRVRMKKTGNSRLPPRVGPGVMPV